MKKSYRIPAWMLAVVSIGVMPVAEAADEREWMSRKGGTVVASLSSVTATEAVLASVDGREIRVKFEDLSLADRQYLIEFGGVAATVIAAGDPGTPEKDARIEAASMVKREGGLALDHGSGGQFEVLETPHFWIATAGDVRPRGIAETAERLWHGMAFQHMNFRRDWGERKMLIIACEDRTTYGELGNWAGEQLAKLSQDAAQRMGATWNQVGATQIYLPDDLVNEHTFLPRALVFNVTDGDRYRRAMGPFQINCISGALLGQQMGGISSFGSQGYFAVTTGHAYYKEILLGGKSETNQLAVDGTGNDEISSKSGFEDGRSWARTLRTMVRKGDITLDLGQTLGWAAADLDPAKLVTIYAFGYYMQSDAKRLSAYAQMIRRIESSKQIPEPIEIARIFGHDSVDAFNADWKEFVVNGNFR